MSKPQDFRNFQIVTKLLLSFFLSQLLIGTLSSCQKKPEIYTPESPTEESQLSSPNPEPTLTTTPTPSPPYQVWVDPSLPEPIQQIIESDPDLELIDAESSAQISISSNSGKSLGSWTYLLVMPFFSSFDNISSSSLDSIWSSGETPEAEIARIIVSPETYMYISSIWGIPDPALISKVPKDQITELLWYNPGTAAIIPFEDLSPSHKVIKIDDKHPLQQKVSPAEYPLAFPIYYLSAEISFQEFLPPILNYDPDLLTSIALTGVTALVRDTAVIMENEGIFYPAEDIVGILRSADITHINNEVPFDQDCPPPTSDQDGLSFCSADKYLELLDYVGADVIELSGDHFGDKGPDAVFHTIELYEENNFQIYGGGLNLKAGLSPIFLEHNGNQFAFIGCNAKAEGYYANAGENSPGAAECDFDWMVEEIHSLTSEGYIVIATMQHEEVDTFFPVALQLKDFQLLADAGASIVSGSQAHHPQGFEIRSESFIHYGLGNLFFDQWYLATRNPEVHKNKDKATIDLHYFYNNAYINTILVPLQFIDNARPRPMTSEESRDFFDDMYYASKWNGRWIYLYPAGYFEPLVIP